jgi:hypothetical protein
MAEQTFDEWLSSEHMKTFIHLRLREIDETGVDYANAHGLIANEATRRELRRLETWRPSVPEKTQEQRRTNAKAGEHRRAQLELRQ